MYRQQYISNPHMYICIYDIIYTKIFRRILHKIFDIYMHVSYVSIILIEGYL